jgi:hypothetical protein
VADECGEAVHGTIEVGAGEREWRFIPARPSASGRCRVHVAPELEDPEGNSLERVFDAELSSGGPLYQRRPCARVSSSSDLGVRRLPDQVSPVLGGKSRTVSPRV